MGKINIDVDLNENKRLFGDLVPLLVELAEKDWEVGEKITEIMIKHNIDFEYKSNKPYWYEIGTFVMFKVEGKWHKAKIIEGHRTHCGIINVQLEDGRLAFCGDSYSVRNECLREIKE